MFFESKLADFFARIGIGILLGMLIGYAISEVGYLYLPDKQGADRAPQQVTYTIPNGTAQKIAAGSASSVIPEGTQFVAGDVLVVKNEDVVAHQLGPLFIPPGTTSSLALDTANTYSYTCSFQTSKYVGLEVLPRVTFQTRMDGLMAVGLPSGLMLSVYSYLVPVSAMPWRKKKARPVS